MKNKDIPDMIAKNANQIALGGTTTMVHHINT